MSTHTPRLARTTIGFPTGESGGRTSGERVKLLMVSDLETSGGAAVAASRLAAGLTALGVEVTRAVATTDGVPHPWRTAVIGPRLTQQLAILGLNRFSGRAARRATRAFARRRLEALLDAIRPDVVNVHNLHAADWGPEMVATCADRAPTVWTLHDMWSFTGRCAYSGDCLKYRDGCDASCPTPEEYPQLPPAEIGPAWSQRQKLLTGRPNLVAVTPSRWLAGVAATSLWRKSPPTVIANPLPTDRFRPIPRSIAREALGLPPEGRLLLNVAVALDQPRKGGPVMLEALAALRRDDLALVTVGEHSGPPPESPIPVRALGTLRDEASLVLAYNAADVLVHPATADNFPNTVAEALACGTPAVGFAVGGVGEMILPGRTGWLAGETTADALTRTLATALADLDDGRDLRESSRAHAEERLAVEHAARSYRNLFTGLVERR